MDNTKDNKPIKKDLTKTIKFKMNRSSFLQTENNSNESEVKLKPSLNTVDNKSPEMPKKTVVLRRRSSGINTKTSIPVGLSTKKPPTVTMKSDTGSEQVEKTLKQNLKTISPTASSSDNETSASTLTLRQRKPVSVSPPAQATEQRDSESASSLTLRKRKPVSVSSPTQVSGKSDNAVGSQIEKTLKLSRKPLATPTPSSGGAAKSGSQIEKTLKLSRKPLATPTPSSEGAAKSGSQIEKTLKLSRKPLATPTPSSGGAAKSGSQIEKTLKLSRKPLATPTPSATRGAKSGSQVEKTLKLSRKPKSPATLSADTENKTDTVKLRVPNAKTSSMVASTSKETGKADSLSIGMSKKNRAVSPPSLVKLGGKSAKIEKKEKTVLKVNSSVSNELSLELDAALDSLSPDSLRTEDEILKKDDLISAKLEKTTPAVKEKKADDIINEVLVSEKEQKEYGLVSILVSLLTFIGLIGVVYLSYLSYLSFSLLG